MATLPVWFCQVMPGVCSHRGGSQQRWRRVSGAAGQGGRRGAEGRGRLARPGLRCGACRSQLQGSHGHGKRQGWEGVAALHCAGSAKSDCRRHRGASWQSSTATAPYAAVAGVCAPAGAGRTWLNTSQMPSPLPSSSQAPSICRMERPPRRFKPGDGWAGYLGRPPGVACCCCCWRVGRHQAPHPACGVCVPSTLAARGCASGTCAAAGRQAVRWLT
jgi:hypothetical protein